ncbi:preprotein translocase subunit SecE [Aerolutibacter ruishenii]|uniref:Protein translocase subunit SecE n=1 Tax=Aerolutibacter ruishenii TaxID=686800 RepID=A0A562LD67_9GAMM|nr:preprotein translocase subunit SecE [Lysobacter ruishenii]TWI05384.1 preprotein translocase subunit SecE [Lysobacter ruishenii]
MNSNVQQPNSTNAGDIVKYVVAILLVVAGLFGYSWFSDWPGSLRALLVVVGLLAGLGVFMLTAKGAQTREFLSESKFELRKVVWPTRQEALQTTWVVMIAVAVLSLILAGFDVVIQAAVKWLLGR